MGKKKGCGKRKERILYNKAQAKATPTDVLYLEMPEYPPAAFELRAFPALKYLSVNNTVDIDQCIRALVVEQKIAMQPVESRDRKQVWKVVVQATDKAVSRAFRRSSIQVHPDRCGDRLRAEFENLKEAYEILKASESRTDYIHKLLVVVRSWGIYHHDFLQREHDGFLQKYNEKQAKEESTRDRYNAAKANGRTNSTTTNNHIESHQWSRPPGWLDIYELRPLHRQVDMGFHFRHRSAYRAVCRRIVLHGHECNDAAAQVRHIWEGDMLQRLWNQTQFDVSRMPSSSLRVTVTLPSHTEWTLRWHTELVVEDEVKVTSSSTSNQVVDMTHPDIQRASDELPSLLQIAKQQVATLKSLTSTNNLHRGKLESNSWDIHRYIAKSRSLMSRLKTTMAFLEQDPEQCRELSELTQALSDATRIKSEQDAQIFVRQRRDTLKSFKRDVAQRIEAGEAAEWIRTVGDGELGKGGTEANRLYQLLMEGKKANALLVDPAMLGNAADRTDLFSEKQCKMLRERAKEAEVESNKETERLMAEAKRHIQVQELAQQLEQPAAPVAVMERGSLVAPTCARGPGSSEPQESLPSWDSGHDDDESVESFGRQYGGQIETKSQPPHLNDTAGILHRKETSSCPPCSTDRGWICHPSRPPRSKDTVWMQRHLVSKFIGKKGRHVNKLQNETRTRISVHQSQRRGEWVPIKIFNGTKVNIAKALDLVDAYGKPKPELPIQGVKPNKPDLHPSSTDEHLIESTREGSLQSKPSQSHTRATDMMSVCEFLSGNKSALETSPNDEVLEFAVSAREDLPRPIASRQIITPTNETTSSNPNQSPLRTNTPNSPWSEDNTEVETTGVSGLLAENNAPFKPPASSVSARADLHRPIAGRRIITPTNEASWWSTNIPTPLWSENDMEIAMVRGAGFIAENNSSSKTSSHDGESACAGSVVGANLHWPSASGRIVTPTSESLSSSSADQAHMKNNIPGTLSHDNKEVKTISVSEFLAENSTSFKVSPKDFNSWLDSEDILTLEDLAEACGDDNYLETMVENGLKRFKKGPFKEAVNTAIQSSVSASIAESTEGRVASPMPQGPLPNLLLDPHAEIRKMAFDLAYHR